jgi:hypothetical protein
VGDQYATRHNPFMYFHSIIDEQKSCDAHDVDYSKLSHDLRKESSTPQFSFITPNLCHDGHDEPCVNGEPGGLVSANEFLQKAVPPILRSPAYEDRGLLIVTFDEAEAAPGPGDSSACCGELSGPNTTNPGFIVPGPGGGRTGAVMISPCISPGTVSDQEYNHYSLLRSVEDLFGLDHLGYAGQDGLAPFGIDLWNDVKPAFARFAGLPRGCVARALKFRYSTGARTTAVTIKIDKKVVRRTATRKGAVSFSVKKLKRGRHTVSLQSAIPSGATATKSASFSRCS